MEASEKPWPFCRELYDEGWLLRCILEYFRGRPEVDVVMNFVRQNLDSDETPSAGAS